MVEKDISEATRMRHLSLLPLLLLLGCLKTVPIDGSRCPCPEGQGYVCCQATGMCVTQAQGCAGADTGGAMGTGGAGGTAMVSPDGGPVGSGADDQPGPAPLRRLNALELRNTIRDLLGITGLDPGLFPPDDVSGDVGFTASFFPAPSDIQQLGQLAGAAAARVVLSR